MTLASVDGCQSAFLQARSYYLQGYFGYRYFLQPGPMARSSWTQPFIDFFKKKPVDLSPEAYLEFPRQCLEEVRTMTSPGASKSSQVINYEQRIYLVDRLDTAIHKASLLLDLNRHHDGDSVSTEDSRESTFEYLKILCLLAKKVKGFIQACCNGDWLHTAVMLANLSDCTASLGFDLMMFTDLPRPSASPSLLSSSKISSLRHRERVNVKKMASIDEDRLVTKLRALIQYGRASGDDLELATFLLERLHRFKQSLPSLTPRPPQPILHERDLTSLKDLVQIGRGGKRRAWYRAQSKLARNRRSSKDFPWD